MGSNFGLLTSIIIFWISVLLSSNSEAQYNTLFNTVKYKGCIASGILHGLFSNATGTSDSIDKAMLQSTACEYLHRAIDYPGTWIAQSPRPEDYAGKIAQIKSETGKNFIYGMFINEAIGRQWTVYDNNRALFNFDAMCRKDPHATAFLDNENCIPGFHKPEYRRYLRYITQKAIDAGVQVFTFAQIYLLDYSYELSPGVPGHLLPITDPRVLADDVVSEMRAYAQSKGKYILIGAQTNDIENQNYLRLFDFIEGGIAIDRYGQKQDISQGKCWHGNPSICQALLWHPFYKARANNVLLALDFSSCDDDMMRFSALDRSSREALLSRNYSEFKSQQIGFLMPLRSYLLGGMSPSCIPRERACNGLNDIFYAPDIIASSPPSNHPQATFQCRDENVINSVLTGKIANNSRVHNISVPTRVKPGEVFTAEITMQNTGATGWQNLRGHSLAFDGSPWGVDRALIFPENHTVKPGEIFVFKFSVRAPPYPGYYSFGYKMIQESVGSFGQPITATIEVANAIAPTNTPTRTATSTKTNTPTYTRTATPTRTRPSIPPTATQTPILQPRPIETPTPLPPVATQTITSNLPDNLTTPSPELTPPPIVQKESSLELVSIKKSGFTFKLDLTESDFILGRKVRLKLLSPGIDSRTENKGKIFTIKRKTQKLRISSEITSGQYYVELKGRNLKFLLSFRIKLGSKYA